MLIAKSASKSHRERKNPHMAEQFAAKRKANNAKRPKQGWSGEGWAR
jgi:hypothetical protein